MLHRRSPAFNVDTNRTMTCDGYKGHLSGMRKVERERRVPPHILHQFGFAVFTNTKAQRARINVIVRSENLPQYTVRHRIPFGVMRKIETFDTFLLVGREQRDMRRNIRATFERYAPYVRLAANQRRMMCWYSPGAVHQIS